MPTVEQQRMAAESLYRDANTLLYADNTPTEDAIDRVVAKINKECVHHLFQALYLSCSHFAVSTRSETFHESGPERTRETSPISTSRIACSTRRSVASLRPVYKLIVLLLDRTVLRQVHNGDPGEFRTGYCAMIWKLRTFVLFAACTLCTIIGYKACISFYYYKAHYITTIINNTSEELRKRW